MVPVAAKCNLRTAHGSGGGWLNAMLTANAATDYLRRHGSPRDLHAYRAQVPLCDYEGLSPWIQRIAAGEGDVLFRGRPCAFERTGGSSGGAKLIPYAQAGIADFRRAVSPWLSATLARHRIEGSVYFSISPAGCEAERLGGIPIGLADTAYLDDAMAQFLATHSAVPLSVAACADLAQWRQATARHLAHALDLELISVWSPTFLLSLLDAHPELAERWPRLKVISCWADGSSAPYARELAARFPGVVIEPKGLISTEAVVTVPDARGMAKLVPHGFFEFLHEGQAFLASELVPGCDYEVVVTTASGLYRYRTGDAVRCRGVDAPGRPWLQFVGRTGLTSDMVGEKLCESFASGALACLPGFAMLVPDARQRRYVVVREGETSAEELRNLESALCRNPQYAYARALGQLGRLAALQLPHAWARVERTLVAHGARLGDIKPTALRTEAFWLDALPQEQR